MLSGVRVGARTSEEEADCTDAGVWVGGIAAAGLVCPLMPVSQHSKVVAFKTQTAQASPATCLECLRTSEPEQAVGWDAAQLSA